MNENPIIRHFFCKGCKKLREFEQLDDRCECMTCGRILNSNELMDLAEEEFQDHNDTIGKELCHQES